MGKGKLYNSYKDVRDKSLKASKTNGHFILELLTPVIMKYLGKDAN